MDLGLVGKIAVVAGASAGIGKSIATSLAREGATVIILSRNKANLAAAANSIMRTTGEAVFPMVCDVSRAAEIKSTISKVLRKFKRVDILVNNAGGPPMRRFLDIKDGDWDEAYKLNLKSSILLSAAVVPSMKKHKWGRIISITSISAIQASETLMLSSVMRPGVHGLTKALSNELAEFGITVNTICPGYTRTERLEELAEATRKATGMSIKQVYAGWEQMIPARRLGKPEELGDLAAFLASERAAYINGVAINIDGGFIKAI